MILVAHVETNEKTVDESKKRVRQVECWEGQRTSGTAYRTEVKRLARELAYVKKDQLV